MTPTETGTASGPLVIGCGNADRGDDVAGLLVARRLRDLGVEALERSGEATGLLEAWGTVSAGRKVIVVDAVLSGHPLGSILSWDAHAARLTPGAFPGSTHGLGLAEALELGRALGTLPEKLLIYGIEGAKFDAGAEPSAEVLRAAEQLAGQIAAEV